MRALLRGIPTAAAQSAAIWTLGDALCQRLERSPDGFDLRRSAVNATYGGAFLGPLGHVWYNGLDAAVARVLPGGGARMIAAKLVADLGVFGPAHLAAFLAFNAAANATDPRRVPPGDPNPGLEAAVRAAKSSIGKDFVPGLVVDTTYWLPVQTVNFAAVPVRHQLAFMNAACVLDGMPGPVTSVDVSADGSMLVWTTPEFVFFTCPSEEHWDGSWKTTSKQPKPAVLQLHLSLIHI